MKRKITLLLTLLSLLVVVFALVSCGDAADTSSESTVVNNSGETSEKETFGETEGAPDLPPENAKWEVMSDTVWDNSDEDRIDAHKHPNLYIDVADDSEDAYYICVFGDRGLYREQGEVDLSNVKFYPDGELTLEVALAALHRLEMGADNADNDKTAISELSPFSDVDAKAWYACHVAWAVQNGIVDGDGDTLGVGEAVTYEELATLIGRYAEKFEKKLKKALIPPEVYADTDRISDEAKDYAEYLRLAGIVRGDVRKMFNPDIPVRRVEAAKIFVKLDEALCYTAEELFGNEEIGRIELVRQRDGGQSPVTIDIRDEAEVEAVEKLLRESKVTYTCTEDAFNGVGTYIKIIGKDNKLLHTYLLSPDGVAVYGVRYYELGEDYLKSLTDKFTETNT